MSKCFRLEILRGMRRQLGVSMLEVMGGMAVGAVVATGLVQQTNTYIDNVKDSATAEHMRLYAQASRGYVRQYKSSFSNGLSQVEVNRLTPFLPAGFAADKANPYGQTPKLVVKKTGNDIEGYLVYSGERAIPVGRRQFVAALAGIGGGYVDEANKPKGPGWEASDGSFFNPGAGGVSAGVGRPVVSLNLFEPVDVLDPRYVCRQPSDLANNSRCNEINVDLNMKGNSIENLSALSSTNLTIYGPTQFTRNVSFSQSVNVTSNVTVGGSVSVDGRVYGDIFVARNFKSINDSCVGEQLGSIAVNSSSTKQNKEGVLLSCQPVAVNGLSQTWQPQFNAEEQVGSIIGCDVFNGWCQRDPASDGRVKKLIAEQGLKKVPCSNRSPDLTDCAAWELTVPSKLFCAVGMVSLDSGAIDNGDITISNGVISGASTSKFNSLTGQFGVVNKPRNDATFCRVKPAAGSGRGYKDWTFRVGTARQVAIACHLVCID